MTISNSIALSRIVRMILLSSAWQVLQGRDTNKGEERRSKRKCSEGFIAQYRYEYNTPALVAHHRGTLRPATFLLDHRRCPISLYEAIFGPRSRQESATGVGLIFRHGVSNPPEDSSLAFSAIHHEKWCGTSTGYWLRRHLISHRNIDHIAETICGVPFNGTQSF